MPPPTGDDTAHGQHNKYLTTEGDVRGKDEEAAVTEASGVVLTPTQVGKGSWWYAGYHMATTIAVPAASMPLPWAFSLLGWEAGIISLLMAICVTWYTSILVASLHNYGGKRHIRYRDLAYDIYGWKGSWAVIFFQQVASIGNNLTIQIVAGASLKAIYKMYCPDGTITLQEFIIMFGALQLVLSQLPDLHSLRLLNASCTFCTVGFSVFAVVLSVRDGHRADRSAVSYEVGGNPINKVMGIFSALGTIAFAFGDTILPEIQATVKPPAIRNMYKGIGLCYSMLTSTYLSVAIAGYWAFGYGVNPYLPNQLSDPSWAVTAINCMCLWQIVGCFQIYARPTYEYFDLLLQDPQRKPFSPYNVIRRLAVNTAYTVLVTLIAAAVPFFGNFVALVGAIGFTPMDFVLPVLLFIKVRNPRGWLKALQWSIAIFYSLVAVLGSIGAIRFIILDAKNYKLFADLF